MGRFRVGTRLVHDWHEIGLGLLAYRSYGNQRQIPKKEGSPDSRYSIHIPEHASFQTSGALLQSPNSRALVRRTHTKRDPG